MAAVRERVPREAPKVCSRDLIHQIFRQPCCRSPFLERADLGTQPTGGRHLRELERLGVLRDRQTGRAVYLVHAGLPVLPARHVKERSSFPTRRPDGFVRRSRGPRASTGG